MAGSTYQELLVPTTSDSDARTWAKLRALESRLSIVEALYRKNQTAWTTIIYGTNWRRYLNSSNHEVQYTATTNGVVLLRGIWERINTTFAFVDQPVLGTLPADLAPSKDTVIWTGASDSAARNNMYRVVLLANGNIIVDACLSEIGANGGVGSIIYADGLTYSLV